MPNAYEVIGVPQDCDDDKVLKTSYHRLTVLFKPDKGPDERSKLRKLK